MHPRFQRLKALTLTLPLTLTLSLTVLAPALSAAPSLPDPAASDIQTVQLAELLRVGPSAASTLVKSHGLHGLNVRHGRVLLDGPGGLDLSFVAPVQGLVMELNDPRNDSAFELRWYRGQFLLGRQRFAPPALGLPDTTPLVLGNIELRSSDAFDRLEVREIHGEASAQDPESVGKVHLFLSSPPSNSVAADPDAMTTMASGDASSSGPADTNVAAAACQAPLGLAYNIAFGAGLVAVDPISAAITDAAGYTSNLGLKFCKTVLTAPDDLNARVPAGTCSARWAQETVQSSYINALGIPLDYNYNWGALGTPLVYHHNTEVDVGLYFGNPTLPRVDTLDLGILLGDSDATAVSTSRVFEQCRKDGSVATSTFAGVEYACPTVSERTIEFPVGRNTVLWRADARMGPLDLIPIVVPATPAGAKAPPWKNILSKLLLEGALVGVDAFLIDGWRWGNSVSAYQNVTVWDEVPPTIRPAPRDRERITARLDGDIIKVQIEADEPGGVSQRNYERILGQMYAVSDACDRPVSFYASYPTDALRTFWPVSTQDQDNRFQITWTAEDPGPNLQGESNTRTATMEVEVVDIRPPAIVAPPDIVEINAEPVSELGQPLVFDFVDLNPEIVNDASLPLGPGLHEVTWTATDASGNSAEAIQIVNVKSSNRSPVALAQTGAAGNEVVSFEPTLLRIEGDDPDGDPLRFTIEATPEEGFFVAPLYPYFVEDFRVTATISDSDITAACAGPTGPGTANDFQLPFPLEPTFFDANDAGITFVLDRGAINCNALNTRDYFEREQRIAKFASDGTLLGAVRVGDDRHRDVVVDDLRQRIYLTRTAGSGASSVRVLDYDLNEFESFNLNNLRNRADDTCKNSVRSNPCDIPNARSAVLDESGLLYVMDLSGLIYAVEKAPGNQVKFVALVSDDVTGGSSSVPADQLALDSSGRLYASRNNRIYQYGAAFTGVDGLTYPGAPIGWLGRCDTDLAPGDEAVCDVTNRRSLGFSCTDEFCGIDDVATEEEKAFCGWTFTNTGNFGCRPGQFRGPQGIDFDPQDNLYVADAANQRIQRFTPEGFFAGEAESACDGSCFVLGDFGNPQDISVNSGRFFILDPESDLLHISLLTPFTDLGPDWAELVYQSNNDFACNNPGNCIDRFEFSVSDGVRDPSTGQPIRTAPAGVELRVKRNFRPPVATPGIVATVNEDTPTAITLDGSELDPLDTLSFVIVEAPKNGTVVLDGNQAVYTGDRDFADLDVFTFAATDGASQSAPEAVTVSVLNLNDPPQVSPLDALTVGAGFRYRLAHDFRDPDTGEAHLLSIDWGDGTIEAEGVRDADGNATGPLLDAIGNGLGRITADHVYAGPGTRTLSVCVTDQVNDQGPVKLPTAASLTDCATATVNVIEAVDVALSVTPSVATALPGQFVSYDYRVTNLVPESGPGKAATGVVFDLDLAHELAPDSISVSGPGCSRTGYAVRCVIGGLQPGSTAEIRVSGQVPATIGIGVSLRSSAGLGLNEPDNTPDNDLLTITPVVRPGDHLVGTTGDALRDLPDANPGDGVCAAAEGVCTLRAAVQEAEASAGVQVIVLGNGVFSLEGSNLPALTDDVVILGNGPENTIIDANGQGNVFNVNGSASLRLEDLTIANSVGPAITASGPTTVRRARFTNNYARFFFGGAILNRSHLELRDVTFDGNRTDNDGGAIWNGNGASSNLVNVTAFGNVQSAFAFTAGTHTLTNVTVTGNTGGTGWESPAAALNVYGANTQVTLTNTVLVDNYVGARGGAPNCSNQTGSRILSGGNNVFGDLAGCSIALQPSDRVTQAAQLDSSADRRGGLPTLRPLRDSLLIDRGRADACPGTDARGEPRPADGNEDGNPRCDIGAVELRANLMLSDDFE